MAIESMPDSGVEIRNEVTAPLLAPCFFNAAAAGSTEVVASAPPEDTAVAAPAPSDVGEPAPSATQVLQSVRIRFVQSLSQVIRTLTPDDQSGKLIFDQQLSYKSSLSLKIHSSLLDLNA